MTKTNKMSLLKLCFLIPLAIIVYWGLSYCVWGWQVIPHITAGYLGASTDPVATIWLLAYWHHAIIQHAGLYFTPLQWAPLGINLTHILSFPLIGVMAFPLTKYFGAVVAGNIILMVTCTVSALCAAFLFRLFTRSIFLVLLCGFIYGFSSYQIAHLMAHLTLVVTFVFPLILYFITQQGRKVFSPWLTIPAIAILLTMQFFISEEIYTTFAFFMTMVSIITYIIMKNGRSMVLRLFLSIVFSYFFSLVVISPYVLHFIQDKDLSFGKNVIDNSVDAINFIIPTPVHWAGGNFFNIITHYYPSDIFEATGYIGLPLLLILFSTARQFWQDQYVRLLVTSITMIALCALGPAIHFYGKLIFPGPWVFFYKLPFLALVMPGRFMLFVFLLMPWVLIYWVENATASKTIKIIVCMLIFFSLIPNPFPGKYQGNATPLFTLLHTPKFLENNRYYSLLKKNSIVLSLPFDGNACYWQLKTNMYFRIANGCLDGPGILEKSDVMTTLRAMSFWNTPAPQHFSRQFAQYVFKNHIHTIIIDNRFIRKFYPVLNAIPRHTTVVGNHTIYTVNTYAP